MIILLDGSKGAGKSTTSHLLLNSLENAVYLSLDEVRRTLSVEPIRDIRIRNQEAFEIVVKETKKEIEEGKNLIIDCGLSEARQSLFEKIASDTHTPLYKFFLKAPYEVQLQRVKERDAIKGKTSTDIQRFDEVHTHIHSKKLDGFTIVETDTLTPQEVVSFILKTIT